MSDVGESSADTAKSIIDQTTDIGSSTCSPASSRIFTSSLDEENPPVNDEFFQLLESFNEESQILPQRAELALIKDISIRDLKQQRNDTNLQQQQQHHPIVENAVVVTDADWYGHPLSVEVAEELMPPDGEDNGIVWDATIIPDEYYNVDGKLKRGLDVRDFDTEKNMIKPRRPSLLVTASDFFSSLCRIEGPGIEQARYVFHGVLNGWPGLRTLELLALEIRRDGSALLPTPKELISGQIRWMKTWACTGEGMRGIDPKIVDGMKNRIHRAKLRGPPWSGLGWSSQSPGFLFWYEALRSTPKVSYGFNTVHEVERDPVCTRIHMVSHRYAIAKRESPKDRLTYHSVCLLEWDRGEYCTVAEAAYLNGIGGYKGKSNWYDDRDDPVSELYKCLPPEMICPWKSSNAEIRCYDIPQRNLDEYKQYISKYEGPGKRFVDPQYTFSHVARLSYRSKRDIAKYLCNYILRDSTYGELKRNCQTFAADLCSFLAGKKGIEPFHPVNRIEYQNRNHLFLYDSHMYRKKKQEFPK